MHKLQALKVRHPWRKATPSQKKPNTISSEVSLAINQSRQFSNPTDLSPDNRLPNPSPNFLRNIAPLTMTSKDYYDILHVHPKASHEEIKRSYRKLALKFHPDKTNNDHLASLHFKEIKEAYEILSNQRKREAYNYERFFKATPPKKTSDIQRISPEWILNEATELRKNVQATDPFRINADGLFKQLTILLSEYNLLVLQHENKRDINEKIIDQLLAATKPLPESIFNHAIVLLTIVAQSDNILIEKIQAEQQARKWKYFWQKYKIVAVILIALILCWLIYTVKM